MFRKLCSALVFSLAISTAAIADDKPETKLKRFQSSSTSAGAVKDLVAEVNAFLGDAGRNQEVLKACEELAKQLDASAKREAAKSPQREALNNAAARVRGAGYKVNGLPMLTNDGRKVLAEIAAALQADNEKLGFADDNVKRCAERAKELSEAVACRVADAQIVVSVKWGNVMILVKYEDGDERKPCQLYMRGASSSNDLKQVDAEVLAIMNSEDWRQVETNDEADVLITWVLYHVK